MPRQPQGDQHANHLQHHWPRYARCGGLGTAPNCHAGILPADQLAPASPGGHHGLRVALLSGQARVPCAGASTERVAARVEDHHHQEHDDEVGHYGNQCDFHASRRAYAHSLEADYPYPPQDECRSWVA